MKTDRRAHVGRSLSARELYKQIYERGLNDYSDDELVELHGKLVDEGGHHGILFCNCLIVRGLFERWYNEKYGSSSSSA